MQESHSEADGLFRSSISTVCQVNAPPRTNLEINMRIWQYSGEMLQESRMDNMKIKPGMAVLVSPPPQLPSSPQPSIQKAEALK